MPPPPPAHQGHAGHSSGYPSTGGYGSKSPSSSGRYGNNYEHQSRRRPVRDQQQQQHLMRDQLSMNSGGARMGTGSYYREQVEVHHRPAAGDGSRGRHVQPRSLSASRGSAGKNNQYHHSAAWVSIIHTVFSGTLCMFIYMHLIILNRRNVYSTIIIPFIIFVAYSKLTTIRCKKWRCVTKIK